MDLKTNERIIKFSAIVIEDARNIVMLVNEKKRTVE